MDAQTFHKKVIDTFDYLHENPELSWKEVHTTTYIKKLLEDAGCTVHTFSDCTGVIGDYGHPIDADTPIVAIRADMDALYQEVDGLLQANHSCGHDAHMSIVLGVLWKLVEQPQLLEKIAVRFIFQPAEEVAAGALKIAEKGFINDVDYLFGIHVRPLEEAKNGFVSPAIIHGAANAIEFDIIGMDAHGARPHLSNNAINIGTHIVNAINTIRLNPMIPHSVKVTKFISGGKNTNIIPGNANLALDLRAQTNHEMNILKEKVLNILKETEQLFATKIEITNDYSIPAAEVDDDAQNIAKTAITKVIGAEYTLPPIVTPGGDDFHFYTIHKPDLKATMIGLGCDLSPGLHHPNMTFKKEAIFQGIDILTEMIVSVYQSFETK